MSKSVRPMQPTHPHPVPKGGSKTEGLKTLGAKDRCWCGKPMSHTGAHA